MLRRVVAGSADVQRCAFAFLSVLLEQDPRSPTFLHTLHLGPVLLGPCFFQHSMAEEAAAAAVKDAPGAIGLFASMPTETAEKAESGVEGVSGSLVGVGGAGIVSGDLSWGVGGVVAATVRSMQMVCVFSFVA